MTSEPEKLLPVIDADIVAASQVERASWLGNNHPTVQAFARHRLTSTTPTLGDMVMVPREPTQDMLTDGWNEGGFLARDFGSDEILCAIWSAMLSAAPASPIPTSANEGEREAQGTFACPICGEDKPHHHTPPIVDAHQTKGSRK